LDGGGALGFGSLELAQASPQSVGVELVDRERADAAADAAGTASPTTAAAPRRIGHERVDARDERVVAAIESFESRASRPCRRSRRSSAGVRLGPRSRGGRRRIGFAPWHIDRVAEEPGVRTTAGDARLLCNRQGSWADVAAQARCEEHLAAAREGE
jgi:hypothetical protein